MNISTKKKSSKRALILAVLLLLVLITAIVTIIFVFVKGEEVKSANDDINSKNVKMETEVKPDVKTEKTSKPVNLQKTEYIFLPVENTMYDNNGNVMNKSEYIWEYYNNPKDYKLSYKVEAQQAYNKVEITRKNNTVTINNKFFQNGKENKELSNTTVMEYYDNTSIPVKIETIQANGVKVPNSIVIQKNEKAGNLLILEIFNKSENSLKKLTINSNGLVSERFYINNELSHTSTYQDYYYKGIMITTLNNTEYYSNNNILYSSKLKVKSEEEVDDNTVKITMVRESVNNGNDKIDYKTEYILAKHILEPDGTATLVDIEE